MKVAFVGVKRPFQKFVEQGYVDKFIKYHLETPYYFSALGGNDVTLVTVDHTSQTVTFPSGGSLRCVTEQQFRDERLDNDVVVHWRSWFPQLAGFGCVNLMHTCDHSYSRQWVTDVREAFDAGHLTGLLTHRGWHQRQVHKETGLPLERLFLDCAQGVDDEVFCPSSNKDPYQMLWASDPGRGLAGAIELTLRLYQIDHGFRLNVCWPDYSPRPVYLPNPSHPAVIVHGPVPCGQKLFDLFNDCGVFPYTSTFVEPSSRSHRQAQAAGSLVLYPPDMGSPSELIQSPITGIVAPVQEWPRIIQERVQDGSWRDIGAHAREFAVSQSWAVQSQNFNMLATKLMAEKGT